MMHTRSLFQTIPYEITRSIISTLPFKTRLTIRLLSKDMKSHANACIHTLSTIKHSQTIISSLLREFKSVRELHFSGSAFSHPNTLHLLSQLPFLTSLSIAIPSFLSHLFFQLSQRFPSRKNANIHYLLLRGYSISPSWIKPQFQHQNSSLPSRVFKRYISHFPNLHSPFLIFQSL